MVLAVPPLPPPLALPDEPIPPRDLHDTVEALLRAAFSADREPDAELAADLLGIGSDEPADHLLLPTSARRFRVEDDRQAEWAMRHQAEGAARLAELAELRDEWKTGIDQWYETEAKRPAALVALMEGFVLDYLRRQREAGRPTVNLPSGVLRSRKVNAKPHVQDSATAAEWVRASLPPEAVDEVIKQEVRVSKLAEYVQLVEVHDGAWYRLELACGHQAEGFAETLTAKLITEVAAKPGSTWWRCDECGASSVVESIEANDVTVWRALSEDGEVVPGVTVEAPKVSYKAVPA